MFYRKAIIVVVLFVEHGNTDILKNDTLNPLRRLKSFKSPQFDGYSYPKEYYTDHPTYFGDKVRTFKYNDPRCGQQSVSNNYGRIVGGSPTEIGEFPWLVWFLRKNDSNFVESMVCSGSLIHSQYVLTAAHCIGQDEYEISSVVLGDNDKSTNPDCDWRTRICADPIEIINVEKNINHPFFKLVNNDWGKLLEVDNDIALIKLARKVTYTRYIRPICLLASELSTPYHFWASGWGLTHSKYKIPSDVKMKIGLPLANNCKRYYPDTNARKICAGGFAYRSTCMGDSGGPLMARINNLWYVAGIVSYGNEECEAPMPTVFTKVSSYLKWIESVIENENTWNILQSAFSYFFSVITK